ncbi:MAG TPA: antitoxin [Chloroflexota bacterium]|nr:antitoxin [Chloroflexota bacterium]
MQLLLDVGRYRKVSREAERRGVSVAAVIRDAIDRLPTAPETRRAAIAAVLRAGPMPVPDDPRELRRELDAAHDRLDPGKRRRRSPAKTRR